MGNRGGRFHSDNRILGSRRWASKQWIACECSFHGRRRSVWGAGYTELFFLDEVTALAAGHRPCFECRRADAKAFAAVFPFKSDQRNAAAMDIVLHAERLNGREKRIHRLDATSLPDGAVITFDGSAFVLRGDGMLAWSFTGYGRAIARPDGAADVLTPPSVLEVLRRGYPPRWYESANP